jgi:hypothetical protein
VSPAASFLLLSSVSLMVLIAAAGSSPSF